MLKLQGAAIFCVIFAFLSALKPAEGFNCYECLTKDKLTDEEKKMECPTEFDDKSTLKKKECDPPYCIKISGEFEGESFSERKCAGLGAKEIFGGPDKCLEMEEYKKVDKLAAMFLPTLKEGTVCICDTENCNPANVNRPFGIGLMAGIVGVWLLKAL